MKIKLDENLGNHILPLLESEGYDVDTVAAEGLLGTTDEILFSECVLHNRVLITLDLDFSNPFRFPADKTSGIIVIRPPKTTMIAIRATVASVLPFLKTQPIEGLLLIVEPGRIRVHNPKEE